MKFKKFLKWLFTSKHKRMLNDTYEAIKDVIDEHNDFIGGHPELHRVATSNWYKETYSDYITPYKEKADLIWERRDWPFMDDVSNYNNINELYTIISNSLMEIRRRAYIVADEIEESIKEMEEFAKNGCSNFFKLTPVGYKQPNIPIYCYMPNPLHQPVNVVPFIRGNIYTTGKQGDKKLMTGSLAMVFANNYHISSDFTYDELERLYIPRRIEMENITNEVKAKEFINKVKEIYRKSKLKEEYNETLRKE